MGSVGTPDLAYCRIHQHRPEPRTVCTERRCATVGIDSMGKGQWPGSESSDYRARIIAGAAYISVPCNRASRRTVSVAVQSVGKSSRIHRRDIRNMDVSLRAQDESLGRSCLQRMSAQLL